jgi:transposase
MDTSTLLLPTTPPPPPESQPLFQPTSPSVSSDSESSQSSQSSQPSQPDTSRDTRIKIQAALLCKVPWKDICSAFGVTVHQISWAKNHRPTPQKKRSGCSAKLKTPQKATLQSWIERSPSHRRVPYKAIPLHLPELNSGKKAVRRALKELGYTRRTAKRSGFRLDPDVMAKRLAFAQEAINWSRERLQNTMFTDETWANGGAHTRSHVTIKKDGSEDFLPEAYTQKIRKPRCWMFWGSIIDGKKGPYRFWEKEWGSINSSRYNDHILNHIEEVFELHPEYWFQQDGASSHRSRETMSNLRRRGIRTFDWPPYSPDLNIIEHVWNWMKNWIQDHYWNVRYDTGTISWARLKSIILAAWDAVPDDYIQTLYDSWYDRCQAVIDAQGGPTRY